MPELPEVETIRRQLNGAVIGRRIAAINATWAKSLVATQQGLRAAITARICGVERQGKLLIIATDGGVSLLVHLRMTGQLLLGNTDQPDRHERVRIDLEDGSTLRFNDQRKFGRIQVMADPQAALDPFLATLGPDALDAKAALGALCLHAPRRHSSIKSLLLDQHVIAGIGNIYADEILFTAGINPATPSNALSGPRLQRLADACPEILNEAISLRGSTLRDYRDLEGISGTYLAVARVHARKGQACLSCSGEIRYGSVAGRGTYWCPSCQKKAASKVGGSPSRGVKR